MKKITLLLIVFIGLSTHSQTNEKKKTNTNERNAKINHLVKRKKSSNGLPLGLNPIDSSSTQAGLRRIYCENGVMHVYTSETGNYGTWSESTTDPHVGRACSFSGYRQ